MSPSLLLMTLLVLTGFAYQAGRNRSRAVVGGRRNIKELHSLPSYYGAFTALACFLPAFFLYAAWLLAEPSLIRRLVITQLPAALRQLSANRLDLWLNDLYNYVSGNIVSGPLDQALLDAATHYRALLATSRRLLAVLVPLLALAGGVFAYTRITPKLRARNHVEFIVKLLLIACSCIAIFTTVGIVFSVLFESLRFFKIVPVHEFLFGLDWSPQMAIRADQVGSSGAFGAVPVFLGTAMISIIAMLISVPVGLMSAIYLSEYASHRMRATVKPLLEILAGIPTVVYGFFAALTVAPAIRGFGERLGMDVSSESALAAGLVMGIMIIPFVSSLSDDVIHAVPQAMRDGALGLGATHSEAVRKVVLPAALPGIVGGVLLAVSRAIGETMIVVMAAGLSANLTANPLEAVTTVTVQIVTLLVGDQEFDSPKTLAAFALGLLLFVITLGLNVIALRIVRKYREQYE
ncbi:MAG: phosphate ABC transporter permease subunit PstC [Thermodesulfobacteriota bacterium]